MTYLCFTDKTLTAMKYIYVIIAVILVIISSPLILIYSMHKVANRISENIYDDSPLEKVRK